MLDELSPSRLTQAGTVIREKELSRHLCECNHCSGLSMAQSALSAGDRAVKLQMMISFKGDFDSAFHQTFNSKQSDRNRGLRGSVRVGGRWVAWTGSPEEGGIAVYSMGSQADRSRNGSRWTFSSRFDLTTLTKKIH